MLHSAGIQIDKHRLQFDEDLRFKMCTACDAPLTVVCNAVSEVGQLNVPYKLSALRTDDYST